MRGIVSPVGNAEPRYEAEPGYEAARDELAAVVARLEAGGLGLEASLALWERGEELARLCERYLAGARDRVEAVLRQTLVGQAGAAGAEGGDDPEDG